MSIQTLIPLEMYHNRRTFIKKGLLLSSALCLPLALTKAIDPTIFNLQTDQSFSTDDLLGKSNPKLYGTGYKLRKEAYEAFSALEKAARKEGFKPQILSSYRNYAHQKRIWDKKYKKYTSTDSLSPKKAIEKIIRYSTIPGTSRHHWGTDFDIIDGAKGVAKNPLNEKHFNKGGVYHSFKTWMDKYAESFGFYEVYTNDKNRKGFNYEPWHFSYLPLSCAMLRSYVENGVIYSLRDSDILGSDHFDDYFIEKYYNQNVLDINPDLVP